MQLALNVADIDAATRFYTDLFGVEPAKERPGHANFEVAEPPLKLVLFHNPDASSPFNHLGVEVATSDDVVAAGGRFADAGLVHRTSEADLCCHAVQAKVWVDAPDVPLGGWEFYTVLADDTSGEGTSAASTCCTGAAPEAKSSSTSSATVGYCAGGSQES